MNLRSASSLRRVGLLITPMVVLLLVANCVLSQETTPEETADAPPTQTSEPAPAATATKAAAADEPALAERVANLRKSIADDEARLSELREKQQKYEEEFEKAGDVFQQLEQQLEVLETRQEKLGSESPADQQQELAEEIERTRQQTELAKERFELAIQGRQTGQQRIVALEAKLEQSRESLKKLLEIDTHDDTDAASKESPEAPQAMPPGTQVSETPADEPAPPATPGVLPIPGADATTPENAASVTDVPQPPSPKVQAAEESLAQAQKAVEKAENQVADVESRLKLLDKNIELSHAARSTALAKARNAEETLTALEKQLEQAQAAGASQEEQNALRQQIADTRQRWQQYSRETQREGTTLSDLQAERAKMLTEQLTAMRAAEAQQEEAQKAEKELARVTNPFSPENIKAWVMRHGPPVGVIIVGMLLALLAVKVLAHRIIRLMVRSSRGGAREEREQRAETLVSVFRNTAAVAIYAGAVLMILDELAIPIAALMGGVAVIGLAVAFGAQNLIKDYFYGFMILLENQYRVKDVVRIAGISGLVENVTLRLTVLRDLEGIVHFIPHGEVKTVSNMTHGWSRVVLDIGVAYKEDADRVMEVLKDTANNLREDPEFSSLILGDPEMLGVDAFGDSAVVIKMLIKTRPLKQWMVKREMLRRTKRRFDELGIEIPFPHRTIYHHGISDPSTAVSHGPSDGEVH